MINISKIAIILANDGRKTSKREIGKVRTIFTKNSLNKAYNKLNIDEKSDIARQLNDYMRSGKPSKPAMRAVQKEVKKALQKNFYDKKLSSGEKELLDSIAKYSDDPKTKDEQMPVLSSWIIWARYHKQTKTVFCKMKRGKMIYPFYNVPRTKWLALCWIGGRYMWDYFGTHYSQNPRYWIRRGGK